MTFYRNPDSSEGMKLVPLPLLGSPSTVKDSRHFYFLTFTSIFWCSINYFPCAVTLPSSSNSLDIIEQTPTHFTPIFSAYIQSILLAFNLPF